MKNKVLLLVLAMMLSAGATIAQNATKSIVYLKNGTSVMGVIMEMQNDTIRVKVSDGALLTYPMSEVESVKKKARWKGRKLGAVLGIR
jgi:sRNA-binding regulator protein Hfq